MGLDLGVCAAVLLPGADTALMQHVGGTGMDDNHALAGNHCQARSGLRVRTDCAVVHFTWVVGRAHGGCAANWYYCKSYIAYEGGRLANCSRNTGDPEFLQQFLSLHVPKLRLMPFLLKSSTFRLGVEGSFYATVLTLSFVGTVAIARL